METVKRYQDNLFDERNSAALYRALAKQEENPLLSDVYNRLALTEEKHAHEWELRIAESGGTVPPVCISFLQ